jgi:hypothetical protein
MDVERMTESAPKDSGESSDSGQREIANDILSVYDMQRLTSRLFGIAHSESCPVGAVGSPKESKVVNGSDTMSFSRLLRATTLIRCRTIRQLTLQGTCLIKLSKPKKLQVEKKVVWWTVRWVFHRLSNKTMTGFSLGVRINKKAK